MTKQNNKITNEKNNNKILSLNLHFDCFFFRFPYTFKIFQFRNKFYYYFT